MVIDNLREAHEKLQGRCPEAIRKGDWPATCRLNTKTCIMEFNPPQECEYYQEYLRECRETH